MTNLDQLMARLTKTEEEYSAAIEGVSESVLSRRPNEKDRAAKEIVCHLRDAEEFFMQRFQIILAKNEPEFPPSEPDRLAVERQYLRNDALEALSSFRKRREETLKFLRGLKPEQCAQESFELSGESSGQISIPGRVKDRFSWSATLPDLQPR